MKCISSQSSTKNLDSWINCDPLSKIGMEVTSQQYTDCGVDANDPMATTKEKAQLGFDINCHNLSCTLIVMTSSCHLPLSEDTMCVCMRV